MKPEQILREALLCLLPEERKYSNYDTSANDGWYHGWNDAREKMKKNIESLDLPTLIERIANT